MRCLKISSVKKDIVEYYDAHYAVMEAVKSFRQIHGNMPVNVDFISSREFFYAIKGGDENEAL